MKPISFRAFSLRKTLIYLLLFVALVPALLISQYFIKRQASMMQAHEDLAKGTTVSSIKDTVTTEIDNLANLLDWFSRDQVMIRGADNILYSSVVWQRLHAMTQISEIVSAIFVLNREGEVMYAHKGSAYHFENSDLYQKMQEAKPALRRGKVFHTRFTEPGLTSTDEDRGVALFSPLLAYTLLEHEEYEPQGTLVVLIGNESSVSLLQPHLYPGEHVALTYGELNVDEAALVQDVPKTEFVFEHPSLYSPAELSLYYFFSDTLRHQQAEETFNDAIQFLAALLFLVVVIVLVLNGWVSQQFNTISKVVTEFTNNSKSAITDSDFRSSEFLNVYQLLFKMRSQIGLQLDELENKNQQIAATNSQLEDFNQRLESEVEQKTAQLQASLKREENYQQKLVRLINGLSELNDVGYHGVSKVVTRHLQKLLPELGGEFSFTVPEKKCKTVIYNNMVEPLAYIGWQRAPETQEQKLLCQLFTQQLGYWLELMLITRRDPMLDAGNRQAFDEDIEYLKSQLRNGQIETFALFVIDINGLKTINDQYGHDLGDELIFTCEALLNQHINQNQMLYRIGGDEFVILGSDMNQADCKVLEERLERAQAGKTMSDMEGNLHPVHFSMGFASTDNCQPNLLFKEADMKMYINKKYYYSNSAK
ncbi:GGDEF domain-containing protein [Vibrio sp. SCSIO 43136]|uniref:GGDEF domain-containing protein n=1 Tax=Vibrio sp. SCSIO 43136 TaxID=2819101 RepID=UPI0020766681|nr:GGDEF domain-containing protein [Vibrio sp. SCSIO 43136]USD64619.1 diguanylate cyclase [Vibrio sp. SCSIO 43136]